MKNRFRTYDLAVAFYHSSQRTSIGGALREQLNRAAPSIVLNLAEGSAKPTVKDQIRFFHIALGSLRECQAIFELALEPHHPVHQEADVLGAHLYKLILAVRRRGSKLSYPPSPRLRRTYYSLLTMFAAQIAA